MLLRGPTTYTLTYLELCAIFIITVKSRETAVMNLTSI